MGEDTKIFKNQDFGDFGIYWDMDHIKGRKYSQSRFHTGLRVDVMHGSSLGPGTTVGKLDA